MAKTVKKPKKKIIETNTKKNRKVVGAKPKVKSKTKGKKYKKTLQRFIGNPVIFPAKEMYWESKATFNPTAFLHDGKIHVIYRAIGVGDVSTLGYASSEDGLYLSDRNFRPIFIHKNSSSKESCPIFYGSGGGWNGGAEDPRVTKIDDKLYMIYTAFDGWGSVRLALTSINLDDFISKKWNWKKPVLISPPGEIHKNWVLFPEKIKGKYAILHSISPKILIDYFNSLDELNGKNFIKSKHNHTPSWKSSWDNQVRGVGPSPIKTDLGWLVFYHAMDKNDPNRYKLGAMLLDKKDPTKVLYRAQKPVLEPDAFYENEGFKSGVIYSCGAVVKDGELFIYYGGADMVSCVATANLKLFLKELTTTGITTMRKSRKK